MKRASQSRDKQLNILLTIELDVMLVAKTFALIANANLTISDKLAKKLQNLKKLENADFVRKKLKAPLQI